MRRLLLLLAITLSLSPLSKGIAFVQEKNAQTGSTATTVTPTATVTAGNLVIAYAYEDASSSAVLTMTDSNSQTYLTAGCSTIGNANSCLFYKENSAAITNLTCQSSVGATFACYFKEFSGIASSSSLDGIQASSGAATGTSLASANLTTTQTNTVLIYAVGNATTQPGAWTAGSGYTLTAPSPNSRNNIQYKIVSSTQSAVSTTMTWGTSATDRTGVFAAFSATSVTTPACTSRMILIGAGC